MASEPPKVFISYNRADRDLVEWITGVIEPRRCRLLCHAGWISTRVLKLRRSGCVADRWTSALRPCGARVWDLAGRQAPPARCKAARRFARARRNACSVGCTDHGTQDLI